MNKLRFLIKTSSARSKWSINKISYWCTFIEKTLGGLVFLNTWTVKSTTTGGAEITGDNSSRGSDGYRHVENKWEESLGTFKMMEINTAEFLPSSHKI